MVMFVFVESSKEETALSEKFNIRRNTVCRL
jgi:hypothetical protein